jgi:hypothetical protein
MKKMEKNKRIGIRLDDKTHVDFMIWCKRRNTSAQTVIENLILGIMQADDKSIESFTKKRSG